MTIASSGNDQHLRVNVNSRALVDKILARYPGEFAVFRELLQNADDARARAVEIEFQSGDIVTVEEGTEKECTCDLNKVQLSRWVVRNDGEPFTAMDWERLVNIAEGNPDEQKIGAFGVGFFSVFSVTDSPVIVSGGMRKRLFYDDDQLLVESRPCDVNKWTIFEMDLKPDVLTSIPKPFDLSRFISTALTFLANVTEVVVRFDGSVLSTIRRTRKDPVGMKLPEDLKAAGPSKAMSIKSVKTINQQMTVVITGWAYSAGSSGHPLRKKIKSHGDPARKRGFFGKSAETNGTYSLVETPLHSERIFSTEYTLYSAEVASNPSQEMIKGIQAATKKGPPKSFLFEAVQFSMSECQRVAHLNEDDSGGLGSVFSGPQGLYGEPVEEHGARLFVGQSTVQTTGIAIHLSSRFIPTMERGLIDLANGQIQKWNEELLYIGGFMARLMYERAMSHVRDVWPSGADQAQKEGLFIMKSFTFRPSTPDPKVADLLRHAFFECSISPSFPIVSNLGIRDSKDVRQPHPEFALFMKQRPVLDPSLVPLDKTMIADLPRRYKVTTYTFRDVRDELAQRTLSEEEMVACIAWWVRLFKEGVTEAGERWKKEFIPVAKFKPLRGTRRAGLSDICKFVDRRGWGSCILTDDPLPPDTIPISFTSRLEPDAVRTSLGWQEMSIVDWIRHITGPGLAREHDIRLSLRFSNRVINVLNTLWPSLDPAEREAVVEMMRGVECIPTSQGQKKPTEAFFPEADLFGDLAVIQVVEFDNVLQELGVRRNVPWMQIKERLPHSQCHPHRLATYLDRVYRSMPGEERAEVQNSRIFASEDGQFHCITDLYVPQHPYVELGLPIIHWRDGSGSRYPMDALFPLLTLGLRNYPPLDVIIAKASSPETPVRKAALDFLITNVEKLYPDYNPADFLHVAFIPCGKVIHAQLGTPEEVFTSPEWELLGFKRLHNTVHSKAAARLRIKERPPTSAIAQALRKNPPQTRKQAQGYFELLSRKGGFTAEEVKELSSLRIVPVYPNGAGGDNAATSVEWVQPRECFLEWPNEVNEHHRDLFNFVRFSRIANDFLQMCGAKLKPDCVDIAEALLRDAHGYLQKARHSSKYLDDFRQVAAGYHGLSRDTKVRIRNTKMFLGFRRKREPNSTAGALETREMVLERADKILIADDMESLRLFGDHVFIAPKEEVFDNFYRDMGAKTLSVNVVHIVEKGDVSKKDGESLRRHVLKRVEIFLYDQDSARRSGVDPAKWHNEPEKFTVKYCKQLHITKCLNLRHAVEGVTKIPSVREKALAGVEATKDGKYILWVTDDPTEVKQDWYDMSVALCRLLFKIHKVHDTSSLMTILDADLDDLRRRGYDVDFIKNNAHPPPVTTGISPESSSIPKGLLKSQQSIPKSPSPLRGWFKTFRWPPKTSRVAGGFMPAEMEDLVGEAINMCTSDDGSSDRTIHQNTENLRREKKKRDVKYCSGLHQTDLKSCGIRTKDGMAVFKTPQSGEVPLAELEQFSLVLSNLGEVFDLESKKLHIFWHSADVELMGFNRSCAIYLNLAHFERKHYYLLRGSDDDKAAVFTAWYFIIAHEIAHNKAFFHDEDHELLFTSIAQSRLKRFRQQLAKVAPNC